MPPTLSIRALVPSDDAVVRGLQLRAYLEGCGQTDALEDDIERDTHYLVGELDDGTIVGCIGAVRPGASRFYFERLVGLGDLRLPADVHRGNTTEGDGLVIAPGFEGHGYGRLLFAAVTLVMEGLGASHAVGLCPAASRGLATKTGYRLTGLQFPVGTVMEELVVGRVEVLTANARPWLQQALHDGRLGLDDELLERLGPANVPYPVGLTLTRALAHG